MKRIFTFLVAVLIATSSFAQYGGNTVTINFKGNQNLRAIVDGRSYSSSDYNENSRRDQSNDDIVIRGMQPGQHSLQLVSNDTRRQDDRNQNGRGYGNSRRTTGYNNTTTAFVIRNGYDLEIRVNNDGSLQLKETRIRVNRGRNDNNNPYNNNNPQYNQNGYAMSENNFQELHKDIRSKWFNGAKVNAINDVFANIANRFSANQAKQLIQLVTGENERLGLAKASLRNIVDRNNINTYYDLFSAQYSRDEFNSYARSYR